MNMQLETEDLLRALETFGDRYHAVVVFADDLSERARQDVAGAVVQEGDRAYCFRVFPDHGVVRLERLLPSNPPSMGLERVLSGAITAAVRQRGEGAGGKAPLGLLVGGVLGTTDPSVPPARRVFAMELDPHSREWAAYGGSLLRWMKSQLLSPEPEAKSVA